MVKTQRATVRNTSEVLEASGVTETEITTIEAIPAIEPAKGTRPNLFSQASAERSKAAMVKAQAVQKARQHLAQAADLYREGYERSSEANEIAGSAAISLYRSRVSGLISDEEINGTLRDVFGAKPTSNGKPGKTPAGEGEAIRKRVVRAVAAAEYASGTSEPPFFAGLPKDEIQTVLDRMEEGEESIWTAYESFAKIKRDHTERTDAAFDAKKIAAIVQALAQPSAGDKLRANPGLVQAYAALIDVLKIIGEGDDVPLQV